MPKQVWEIWERVAEVWNKIPPEVCQNLIESLPRRLEAVIKATYKVLEFLVSGFLTGSYKIDSMIPQMKSTYTLVLFVLAPELISNQ